MHQISVKWTSDKHQMPSDNTDSTYLIMESINYWSHFIGFILWGVKFLESLYSRVRTLGFFKQFKHAKLGCIKESWWYHALFWFLSSQGSTVSTALTLKNQNNPSVSHFPSSSSLTLPILICMKSNKNGLLVLRMILCITNRVLFHT